MRRTNKSNAPPVPTKPVLTLDILSLFPNVFSSYLREGLIAKAIKKGLVSINVYDLRIWARDRRRTADDRPYGGGAGMIMKIEPIATALRQLKSKGSHTIMLSPRGNQLTQQKARSLAKMNHLILICGHYEGVDQRVSDHYADEELSIGDYVLSGGESAAIAVVDAVTRLVPGFLGNGVSLEKESFEENLLEFPQYTRPEKFNGYKVPKVLLEGNHKEIGNWRKKKAREITKQRRPDLLN